MQQTLQSHIIYLDEQIAKLPLSLERVRCGQGGKGPSAEVHAISWNRARQAPANYSDSTARYGSAKLQRLVNLLLCLRLEGDSGVAQNF